VSAPGIVGRFNGLADGDIVIFNGVELVIHYTATTVTLSFVREVPDVVRNAADVLVLGADAGAQPRVKVLDAKDGSVVASFLAYNAAFRGGVRVAVADLNRDGEAEVIVAPGAGMSTLVKVFDLEGRELLDYRTKAYAGFSGGVFVAAGDVNGDGRVDIITSPGQDLNSNIKVFKNRVGIASSNPDPISDNPIYSFLAFDTITRRGATVAAGDFNRDGKAEIVVGNVAGTSPLVRVRPDRHPQHLAIATCLADARTSPLRQQRPRRSVCGCGQPARRHHPGYHHRQRRRRPRSRRIV
jgi:hypothetical protein